MGQIVVDSAVVKGVPVVRITTGACAAEIEVQDGRPFAVDDRVLIHQAKGMLISTAVADSGRPISQGNCGNYEIAIVNKVVGNTVYLTSQLLKAYDVAGLVQLVPVIHGNTVTVNGPLTAAPWNGSCGGIIAIEATDVVTLNSSLSVSGIGFSGGSVSLAYNYCQNSTEMNAAFPSALYGQKGEGSVAVSTQRQSGRGRLASGGGGGGNHNAGGGGGGNGGSGGVGGAVYSICGAERTGGLGGSACIVDPAAPRLFLGGAGGGGHQNENFGKPGGGGGGIIVIVAPTIVCNNKSVVLTSRGVTSGQAEHEGASGGGAGGTILLGCTNLVGQLVIDVSGGKGGDLGRVFQGPHGPGGGGGGGQILFTEGSVASSVLAIATAGTNGVNTQYPTGVERDWYSESGSNGRVITNCILSPLPNNSMLVQLTPSEFGERGVGSADLVDIVYVNNGDAPFRVDSAHTRRNLLKVISTVPPYPVVLKVKDTLIVRAQIQCPSENLFADTLDFTKLPVGGCDGSQWFPFTWNSLGIQDSCFFGATLSGDTVGTGGEMKIVAKVDRRSRVFAPAHFTAIVRYASKDLYVAPRVSGPAVSLQLVDNETLLRIEDDWLGGDTLFTLDALGLLSTNSSTSITFDSLSIFNGYVACQTVHLDSTLIFEEVCISRRIRAIQFVQPNVKLVSGPGYIEIELDRSPSATNSNTSPTLSVWSVIGTQVEQIVLSNNRTLLDLRPGCYVVHVTSQIGVLYSSLVVVY